MSDEPNVTIFNKVDVNAKSKINAHWDAFKDNVHTAFTVVIICSTYILGFIFGAAIGTGLAVSYRKELASCETFVDLNIYLWTVEATIYVICFSANPYVYGFRNKDITEEFRSMLAMLNPISFIRSRFQGNFQVNTQVQTQSHVKAESYKPRNSNEAVV
jgi:hypothetical protein